MSDTKKITPILIFGTARNGTTWLCNLVGSSEEVLHIEHPLHHGLLESNLFLTNKVFRKYSSFSEFFKKFHNNDYYKLLKIDEKVYKDYKNYYHLYFDIMDKNAQEKGKKYWLTKFDPFFSLDKKESKLFFSEFFSRYNDFKFVIIRRNDHEVLNSYIKMSGKHHRLRKKKFFRLLLGYKQYVFNQNFYYFIRKQLNDNCFKISYQNLIENYEKTIAQLTNYIGLMPSRKLQVEYKKNTSFMKENDIKIFSNKEYKTISTLSKNLLINNFILRLIKWTKKKPPFFQRIELFEKDPKFLYEQLILGGEYQLAEYVKKRIDKTESI